jgi:hypothetical protein
MTRIVATTLTCHACERLPAGTRCPERCMRNFVLSSWSSSLKASRDAGMITTEDWDRVMHEQIAKICARPECKVLVAVGDERVFLGFIAGEPTENIVYYCYVKELHRKQGHARALFGALGIVPTSRFAYPCGTRALHELRDKVPLARFDPTVARYPKSQRKVHYA